MRILIGSTFPLNMIRRKVQIAPASILELQSALQNAKITSFWGHENTLSAAKDILGVDLTPATSRPALSLSANNLPMLDDIEFNECWVLSPNYVSGFRPEIGSEVTCDKIKDWEVLKIEWKI